MLAKELPCVFAGDFAPALALGRDLMHADRDLRGAEIANGDGNQDGFANHILRSFSKRPIRQYRQQCGSKIKVPKQIFVHNREMAISGRSAKIG